jgi:hypothetical protein
MTATVEDQTLEYELLDAIDNFMSEISHVSLVDAASVVNFALDLRLIVGRHSVN